MLVGILTELDSIERRQAIRETWISFDKDMGYDILKAKDRETKYYKVCSLFEIRTGQSPMEDCLLIYTFVVAAGTDDSPYELLHPNATHPITVPGPKEYDDEKDITYLNVKENMNAGKVPTWFAYASVILPSVEGIKFDYIAKMDDDTLLFTGNWFDVLERYLPKPYGFSSDGLVYGGSPNVVPWVWFDACELWKWEYCPVGHADEAVCFQRWLA